MRVGWVGGEKRGWREKVFLYQPQSGYEFPKGSTNERNQGMKKSCWENREKGPSESWSFGMYEKLDSVHMLDKLKVCWFGLWTIPVFFLSFFFFRNNFLIFIFIYLFGCAGSYLQHAGFSIFVALCSIFSWGIWTLSCSMWDLVPRPGIEPRPSVLGAQSLSLWTTRKAPPFQDRKTELRFWLWNCGNQDWIYCMLFFTD